MPVPGSGQQRYGDRRRSESRSVRGMQPPHPRLKTEQTRAAGTRQPTGRDGTRNGNPLQARPTAVTGKAHTCGELKAADIHGLALWRPGAHVQVSAKPGSSPRLREHVPPAPFSLRCPRAAPARPGCGHLPPAAASLRGALPESAVSVLSSYEDVTDCIVTRPNPLRPHLNLTSAKTRF